MKSRTTRTCVAATLAAGLAAFAQLSASAQQPPSTAGAQAPAMQETKASAQSITVTGCIQSEADYRKAHAAGAGGAAGTGLGVGNEFILINAALVPAAATSGTTGTSGAVGTSGTVPEPSEYELSGSGEGQAKDLVGKRVEITGKLKAAEVQAGQPTGGDTAGKPPAGVDVAGKDLKLREIDVASIREVPGTCPSGL